MSRFLAWLNAGENHIVFMAWVIGVLAPLAWWITGDWSPIQ